MVWYTREFFKDFKLHSSFGTWYTRELFKLKISNCSRPSDRLVLVYGALVSFSKTSNCTRPIFIVFEKLTRAYFSQISHTITYLLSSNMHEKIMQSLYKNSKMFFFVCYFSWILLCLIGYLCYCFIF